MRDDCTYLTIPKPKLTIITSIRAKERLRADTISANFAAPVTEKKML